jgi:hypothetical protein
MIVFASYPVRLVSALLVVLLLLLPAAAAAEAMPLDDDGDDVAAAAAAAMPYCCCCLATTTKRPSRTLVVEPPRLRGLIIIVSQSAKRGSIRTARNGRAAWLVLASVSWLLPPSTGKGHGRRTLTQTTVRRNQGRYESLHP